MIKIITKNNTYLWNYKQLGKNLLIVAGIVGFVVAYLIVAKMDFLTMIG